MHKGSQAIIVRPSTALQIAYLSVLYLKQLLSSELLCQNRSKGVPEHSISKYKLSCLVLKAKSSRTIKELDRSVVVVIRMKSLLH